MDQHYNTPSEFLHALLANPADETGFYIQNLEQLVIAYPQSGILHALLARHSEEKNLQRAATYFNPGSLYKLVNAPSSLKEVTKEQLIGQKDQFAAENLPQLAETFEDPAVIEESENYFSEQPAIEESSTEKNLHTEITELTPAGNQEEITTNENELAVADEETVENSGDDTAEVIEEAGEPGEIVAENEPGTTNEIEENQETEILNETPEIEAMEDDHTQKPAEPIEEEVFDEITGVENINIEPAVSHPASIEHIDTGEQVHETAATEEEEWPEPDEIDIATEKLILNNIAGADFFSFDKAFKQRGADNANTDVPLPTENGNNVTETLPAVTEDTDTNEVSKYHDDTLPYSFMWWLDKTRKEHRGIYQPYAQPPAVANNTGNKLEQQYYENIFHITSVEDLEKSTSKQTIQFDMKPAEHATKEHEIIERFLKEEPQIRPQSSDKLDNENKAKRSSEDKDDEIITETLAAIYTDQMLYHKAIAAYKKLMLKFPEKSALFADKIEQLEKKTN